MKKNKILNTLIFIFSITYCYGQTYLPITIYSPQLDETSKVQTEIGINNFGLNSSIGFKFNKIIGAFHYEYNNGNLTIDPLNFNEYRTNRIQYFPSKHNYLELFVGYKFRLTNQKLSTYAGIGNHLTFKKWRYFVQIDWGNESKIIDTGFSLRGTYSKASSLDIFNSTALIVKPVYILSPAIYGKLKLWKIYINNQFGYVINLNEDSIQPVITFGIGYEY